MVMERLRDEGRILMSSAGLGLPKGRLRCQRPAARRPRTSKVRNVAQRGSEQEWAPRRNQGHSLATQ